MTEETKRKRITLALCIGAVGLVFVVLSYYIPIYKEICEKDVYTGQKECGSYHLFSYLLLYVFGFIDQRGVAITALATIAIAVFTLTLYRATTAQGRLTRESIDLARKEFISTHRPRIALRNVYAVQSQDFPITVTFSLVNSGETDAWIIQSAIVVEFPHRPDLMLIPESKNRMDIALFGPLKAGELRTFVHIDKYLQWNSAEISQHAISVDDATHRRFMQKGLFFVGQIAYRDDLGTIRYLVFRHRYESDRSRFYPYQDTELNYAD